MKLNYYRASFSDEYSKQSGIYGIIDSDTLPSDIDEFQVLDTLPNIDEQIFNETNMFFEGAEGKVLADYQMSYFPWRFLSKKLYQILKRYSDTNVTYIPVNVNIKDNSLTYYLMIFKNRMDVLDKEKTGSSLLKPILKKDIINDLPDVFCYIPMDTSNFCISSDVRNAIKNSGVTGMEFQLIS